MFEERMKSTLREIYRKGSAIINSGNLNVGNSSFNYSINDNTKQQNKTLSISKQSPTQSNKSTLIQPLITTNFHNTSTNTTLNVNYPLQLIIIDEFIWFTNVT